MGSYCSSSDVAILTPVLTRGASDFGPDTQPTKAQVETMVRWVFGDIQARLGTAGYSGSAAEGSDLHAMLTWVNALGAAALAEQSRISDTISAGERTRGQVLWRMYESQVAGLVYLDLSKLGLPPDQAVPYAGGTSHSDKRQDEQDADVVQPRFRRGLFRYGSSACGCEV